MSTMADAHVTTDEVSWDDVLDEYDRALTRQERAVENADADLDACALEVFVPPTGLGPMPARLLPRAERLRHRTDALAELVGRLVTAAAPEPPTVRRRNPRSAPSSLDLRV